MKILIIRFSSFGDIAQCMGSLPVIKKLYPQAEIEWATKSSFTDLVESSKIVSKVWSLSSKANFIELIRFGLNLRSQKYDLVYDAHQNMRSLILNIILFGIPKIKRGKNRIKRFLFKLGINKFPKPFRGMHSYIEPIDKKSVSITQSLTFDSIDQQKVRDLLSREISSYIVLAPSAAWEMKRWPIEKWIELVNLLEDQSFILIGGPEDTYFKDLEGPKVVNLAGKLSFLESAYVISLSKGLISADTGALHLADLMGVPSLALIGPTAFGYPSNPQSIVIEKDFDCRPCTKDGRGECSRNIYQECMVSISSDEVAESARTHF
ncbi:MAG: glycosyltransferase family 9 protein [Bdellovibrionales bacterium]|nr:glycosyltransferase family 9 protein [Bdellovibrionales bacterium]